ncbi:CRISPR-associated endonuclease Cas2 [Candidatus Magnetobacterium casense]|uniref:CRISPR-associated endonuclease Cas2 n=1 Tax=Candidatus Magnetobacterium casense TaxID=1455061 RepID=UPI000590F048|nr:CRISPR-associated endonuclease Cas2 [Candidatus Magnetobacterium casensis]
MPYYVVTYDIGELRVNKVRKALKKYLHWVQNSVFEGELSVGKLQKCRQELLKIIDLESDSVYFYVIENRSNLSKAVLGLEKEMTGNIF